MYPPPCSPKRQGRSEKEITTGYGTRGHSASNAAKRQEKGGEYALWLQYAAAERVVSLGAHERAKDAAAKKHYAALRQAGHSHGRATRGVADRWLAVLMAMLKAGTLYDPERRGKGQATKVS